MPLILSFISCVGILIDSLAHSLFCSVLHNSFSEGAGTLRPETDSNMSGPCCLTRHHTHKAVNQELSCVPFVMERQLCGRVLWVIDGSESLSDCTEHPSLSEAC